MTSGLNPYQIAVLQEMGICVWQSQAVSQTQATSAAGNSHTAELTPSGAAVPSQSSGQPAANGQARIAQLRSMLGNKPDKKPSAPEKVQDDEAKPASPVVETIDPRSFGAAGQDILQALSLFYDAKSVRWQFGSELSLKNNILSLPYKTAPSDAAEKRRLWQVICAGQ